MKTKGLGKLLFFILVLSSISSCKEEEFYEKEFIDTLNEKYERENLPDDVAEAPYDDVDNNPDLDTYVPPSEDGSVVTTTPSGNPNDSSSDSSSDDDHGSSSDDGSVADSGNTNPADDYTPGNDDGSVADSGNTTPDDDYTPGNDDGSVADSGNTNPADDYTPGSDDGSVADSGNTTPDDDYTPGSDDGSVADSGNTNPADDYTPGSDDGSVADSGNTDPADDYTPGGDDPVVVDEPTVALDEVADEFAQNISGSKLDILWVVDNSGSMGDEQKALGENFDAFIKEFVNKGIDFQMAVTTTDTSRNNAGREYKNSMELLTSAKLKADKAQFMADFKEMVKVGVRGSGYERGIKASEVFADRFSNKWMRPDAYFIVVYMSDEEDQSKKSVPAHLKQIQKWKSNNSLIKAYSIVDMVPTRKRGAISRGYARYNEISELTGGAVASIKGDFHATLLDMGENIAKLTEQFPLSKVPYNAQIKVLVDGVESMDWSYDAASNSVTFNADAIPAAGASIRIEYGVEQK